DPPPGTHAAHDREPGKPRTPTPLAHATAGACPAAEQAPGLCGSARRLNWPLASVPPPDQRRRPVGFGSSAAICANPSSTLGWKAPFTASASATVSRALLGIEW